MTVFKTFLKISWSHRGIALTYFAIFFIISILTLSTNTKDQGFIQQKVEFALLDKSNTEASEHLTKYLEERHIRVENFRPENLEEDIYLRKYRVAVVIEKDFSENYTERSIRVHKSEMDRNQEMLIQEIKGYLFLAESCQKNGKTDYALLNKALAEKTKVHLVGVTPTEEFNRRWAFSFMNASSYTVMSILLYVLGMGMTELKRKEIRFRNHASGYSVLRFQSQIFLGQAVIGCLLVLAVMAQMVFWRREIISDIPFFRYALNLVIYMIALLSFNYLITSTIKNKYVITALANLFSLGSSFLSGVFVPLELLGEKVIGFAKFFPTYYFVVANEKTMIGIQQPWKEHGIILLFAFAFLTIGLYLAKVNLQEKTA